MPHWLGVDPVTYDIDVLQEYSYLHDGNVIWVLTCTAEYVRVTCL